MQGSELFAVASDHRARPIPYGPESGSAYAVDRQPDDPGADDGARVALTNRDDRRRLVLILGLPYLVSAGLVSLGLFFLLR